MTKTEFLQELSGVLNLPVEKLVPALKLEGLDSWDSTAVLGVIALLEGSVGVEVQPDQVSECKNVGDLMNLCQGKLS
jgi:acyl carrier protein